MTEVRHTGTKMVNLPCQAVATIKEGYVCEFDTNGHAGPVSAKNDIAIAIVAYTQLDPQLGTVKTMTAGDSAAFYLIGSGAIVNVASENSITYQSGDPVYLGQTTYYFVDNVGTSATMIGHYFGPDNYTTTSAGELIPVVLDVKIGG